MMHDLSIACSGAVLLGFGVISLFFWRFWQLTRERLFACFAVAFLILAIERVIILTVVPEVAHHPLFYCTRLVAFLVVASAIWDKNRAR